MRNIVISVSILFALWLYGEIKYRFAVSEVDYSALFRTEKQRITTDYIIIHHTAIDGDTASILAIYDYHKNVRKWSCGFAYHFFQMRGVTYKIHADNDATAHATSYNFNSVSICVQENFSNAEPTFEVYWEVAALATRLARKYDIPIEHIKAHREVEKEPTDCPGTNFDIEKVRTLCRLMQTIFI